MKMLLRAGRGCLLALAVSAGAQAATPPTVSPALTPAQANLVDVATLIPDLALEIRYAGAHNFVGRPVDGYRAPKCYLLQPVAEALAGVAADLRQERLRLRVFDCYRPVRAVQDFVRWSKDLGDQRTKPEFYPNLDKSALLGEYIAEYSGHSRGATLDLGVDDCRSGRCVPLDMGTAFDMFDLRANTDAADISPAQRDHRQHLRAAMERHGFANYPLEWWHYTWRPEPTPDTAYDVIVE